MKANNRLKSRMKKLRGTIRSKGKNGNLYYRLTIASGLRKEFPLKTNQEFLLPLQFLYQTHNPDLNRILHHTS